MVLGIAVRPVCLQHLTLIAPRHHSLETSLNVQIRGSTNSILRVVYSWPTRLSFYESVGSAACCVT